MNGMTIGMTIWSRQEKGRGKVLCYHAGLGIFSIELETENGIVPALVSPRFCCPDGLVVIGMEEEI